MNVHTISSAHPFEAGAFTLERILEAKRLLDSITPSCVFGDRIFFSAFCLKETTQPVRVYTKPRWQSARKAALVQKKWNKRWGFRMEPCIFRTPLGFFAHPSFKQQLEQAMAREQIIRERRALDPRFIVP